MQLKSAGGNWLRHINPDKPIERASTPNTVLSLLASKNGTEIIHHSLTKKSGWGLRPQPNWDELEAIYLLSGALSYKTQNSSGTLCPGELLSAEPVKEYIIFNAIEDSTFLYICSSFVFHEYSEITKTFKRLAVEIETKDGYTASHCDRIRKISYRIGERIGLSSNNLAALRYGAFFHDIGKINIPNEILGKPGKLTKEEFDIMKTHTILGKGILSSTDVPHLLGAGIIAEQHHERYDGSGYPYGLKGEEINVCAAIVAVVDSFDAMTSDRPYQSAKSKEQAITEIAMLRGKLYHPDVVDAFLAVICELEL